MKKLYGLLAVLLAASPALSAVRITADPNGNTVAIKYDTDGEKVRAFALDITVDKGKIVGISDFIRGESTAANPGYGIFPANFARYITVNADTGEVAKWDVNDYTPVADPCDTGALGGLGTNGITIEMGALYYPTEDNSPNAPPNSGTLFNLTVSEPATVTIALNEIRGGVVLTDPEKPATVTLSQGTAVVGGSSVAANRSDYAEWVAVGKPVCWTYPRQCYGDADGQAVSTGTGSYYVGTADLNILLNAWQVKETPFGPGIASIEGGICADFGHDKEGNDQTGWYRVGTKDLNILIGSWLVKEPPAGPGVPADCATRVQQ
jgi:hypothetical protein